LDWRESFIVSVFPAVFVIIIRRKIPESDLWLKNKINKKNIIIKNSLENFYKPYVF
jgi:hypothetical protein